VGNEQNTLMTAVQQAGALGVLSSLLDDLYGPFPSPGRPALVGPDTHSIHDAGSPNGEVLKYLADFAAAAAKLPLHAVTHHEYIEIDYSNVLNASFLDASALLGAQVVAELAAGIDHVHQHVVFQPGRLLTEFCFQPACCTSVRPLAARDWHRRLTTDSVA
jgi:hypothetical protein